MHVKKVFLLMWLCLAIPIVRADRTLHRFERQILSDRFYSEGACFADIDGDGDQDIVSGPYWYEGPDFEKRHAYTEVLRFAIAQYSRHFFSFAHDFNGDGRPDILAVPTPGEPARWFENPGVPDTLWASYEVFEWVGNESPHLVDLTGDGRVELVFCYDERIGYAEPDWKHPENPWTFTAITERRGYGRYTHGLGVGDINGDGRADVLETEGWWEQPEEKGALFRLHEQKFAQAGGAQMHAYDFDGDGDNDVVSSQNAHAYGLSWFEQVRDGGRIAFREHRILTEDPAHNAYGLSFSQMHALAMADIDGDGIQDIITGKRFYAHGGADPGAHELPVLYWFQTVREPAGVRFVPWLIDERAGVGTQLTVGDVTGDGLTDVLVGNKVGTSLLRHQRRQVGDAEYEAAAPKPRATPAHAEGTDIFATHVRSTEPLDPEEELATLSVPAGFEVQLVASEPEIAKPLNMAFDGEGRLWLTNTVEYPYAAPGDREGRDSIKILEDFDLNGRAHKITTFADNLNVPIGLYPYHDGVICFSIPNIWFLRDTDGDGKADRREVLYGPFGYEKDTHGMVNSFTRGADGWIYACHGFNNTSSVAGKNGHRVEMQSGNVFRFRPDGSRIELYTHGQVNPFGMAINAWGDIFTADCHTKPVSLLLQGGHHESFGKPHDGLGFIPSVMDHLHNSTAICGMALGAATAFPSAYEDSAFGGDVMTSRVHRDHLLYDGASVRAEEAPDFLIAGDPWFRPVDLQVGPDGALYVADFYNRIIGHYEVQLDHPGRDRHRGRIWRVVYRGGLQRMPDLSEMNPQQLAEVLKTAPASLNALALDRLSDHHGTEAVTAARALLSAPEAQGRRLGLWTLHRLEACRRADLEKELQDGDPKVRAAVFQILGERRDDGMDVVEWALRGFEDTDPMVRRSAVAAAAQRPQSQLIRSLIDLFRQTTEADAHLRHSIRIALREHLKNDDWFRRTADAELDGADALLLADVSLAVKTPAAGEFVLRHLDRLMEGDRAKLETMASFAARFVAPESVDALVSAVRTAFPDDLVFQRQLLEAVTQGLRQKGAPLTGAVRSWALDLATSLLGSGQDSEPIGWTYLPYPGVPDEGNPWVLSTRRDSADGEKQSRLWSTFPSGEQRRGILRSELFRLGESLTFYAAGHDGMPPAPLAGKNLIRLRDASDEGILQEWQAPRNDLAQPVSWDSGKHAGKEVVLELIDGDAGSAFAWLAVGRFSESGLNPSEVLAERRLAASLVAAYGLEELREPLVELLEREGVDGSSQASFAQALAALHGDARAAGVAEIFAVSGAGADLRSRAVKLLKAESIALAEVIAVLEAVMAVAGAEEQARLANLLAGDAGTASILVDLTAAGKASPRLLARQDIAQKLDAVAPDPLKHAIAKLTEDLPEEDPHLEEQLAKRRADYLVHGGSAGAGKELFAQLCAACHQVEGVGGQLAPNLDGIGNRGLDRLTEDLLAPNRNVDVAFRATTVTTKDGAAHFGFVRRKEGEQWVLADSTGKEFAIDADSVTEEIPSPVSLMPPHFDEILSPAQFRDLTAYLLSLRGNS